MMGKDRQRRQRAAVAQMKSGVRVAPATLAVKRKTHRGRPRRRPMECTLRVC